MDCDAVKCGFCDGQDVWNCSDETAYCDDNQECVECGMDGMECWTAGTICSDFKTVDTGTP